MGVSLTVLGSGSRGNGTLVRSSRTTLLVDCGLSCKELTRRMAAVGVEPGSIAGVLITHEHADHVGGLHVMAKKHKLPVYMTEPAHATWVRHFKDSAGNRVKAERLEVIRPGHGLRVGDIDVMPFTIPHDAADPVGYTFVSEGIKLAIVTDLGYIAQNVKDHLRGCNGLMIESNHDLEMLRTGSYPWAVKQRVLSRVGHLSNDALAEFLSTDYDGEAAFVVLAHLSEQNNHPEIARTAAERALGSRRNLLQNALMLASQHEAVQTATL